MTRDTSKVSDEILLSFMEEMKKDRVAAGKEMAAMRDLISLNAKSISLLDSDLRNHIQNSQGVEDVKKDFDRKANWHIFIIGILITILLTCLGYIWGKEKNNERVRENIESTIKGFEAELGIS